MLKRDSVQMELNFNGSRRNRFRSRVSEGVFQVLVEIPVPGADSRLEDAVARFSDFQYLTEASSPVAAGLAFVNTASDPMDPVLFASALAGDDPDAHLLYLSGRSHSAEQILSEAKHAVNQGFRSLCFVSGAAPVNATAETLSRTYFLESVNALHLLREENDPGIFTGASINPFKYTPGDSMAQYAKAVRKIGSGASFLVTQYGWDMKKLQELRWQLWRRSFNIPLFARFLFLTQDRAAALCAGRIPGIRLSPDFESALKAEMRYSSAQFKAAQIRRIQLHAAGALLLGYSGIQLAGVDQPELFQSLLQRIHEAFREFSTFEEWLAAYREYYSRMDLAPYPYRYYMFENLFSQAQPPDEFELRNAPVPECTRNERWRYFLSELLFRHASELPAEERRLSKKLLLGCRSCEKCRLPMTFYICPEQCPKGMSNGPCGCSRPDGSCEYTGKECLFVRMFRLSNELRDFVSMENGHVEQPSRRPL